MRKLKIRGTKIAIFEGYHLQFQTHYEMCLAFVRIQEFYESPLSSFRGKHFTLDEYMDWYSQRYGKGVFTYPDDWSGFNVPSHMLSRFLCIFKDLRPWEQDLLQSLKDLGVDIANIDCDKHQFYVIATVIGDRPINFKHELCHGLFYMNSNYKKEVEEAVKKYKLKRFRRKLLNLGYNRSVLIDEIQAYLMTESCSCYDLTDEVKSLQKELKVIKKKYIGGRVK